MEKERAYRSVDFLTYSGMRGKTAIGATAFLSVFVLVCATGYLIYSSIENKNAQTSFIATASAASPTDAGVSGDASQSMASSEGAASDAPGAPPITDPENTPIGSAIFDNVVYRYISMKTDGSYSADGAKKVAQDLGTTLDAPVQYTSVQEKDLTKTTDTSYARMLAYRADLQKTLKPLTLESEPEYAIFAQYVQTGDASYLDKLHALARTYRAVASATAQIVVPQDALVYHLAIVNSMLQFGATLDALADNAHDPIASVALLKTYNSAESDMLTSFNALYGFWKTKRA